MRKCSCGSEKFMGTFYALIDAVIDGYGSSLKEVTTPYEYELIEGDGRIICCECGVVYDRLEDIPEAEDN